MTQQSALSFLQELTERLLAYPAVEMPEDIIVLTTHKDSVTGQLRYRTYTNAVHAAKLALRLDIAKRTLLKSILE